MWEMVVILLVYLSLAVANSWEVSIKVLSLLKAGHDGHIPSRVRLPLRLVLLPCSNRAGPQLL